MLLILLAIVALVTIYYFATKTQKYWTEKGVKQTSPPFLIGDQWKILLGKQSFADLVLEVYNAYPNTRYMGMYHFTLPTLVLRDPELIKQITVKNFDHFVDRITVIPPEIDQLWSSNLFALTGQEWRDMRSKLSPAFTSSKMKLFFTLISENADEFVQHFLKQGKNDVIATVEFKDIFTRFTNDVIASIAFGVKCDSLGNPNNEFYTMGKSLMDFAKGWKNLKFVGYLFFPKIFSFLKVSVFSKTEANFFTQLMKETIESREKHDIIRPDLVNLLMEARKHNGIKHEEKKDADDSIDTGFATVQESEITNSSKSEKREITDIDITAQALIFFFAGFGSVAGLMCFMAYELAVNPDLQKKLQNEIDETKKNCAGKKLTYEALLKMKYMDMVISETLRKWPHAIAVDRVCTKSYTIQPATPDETPIVLNKGEAMWLPILGLHRDPQYFPDPDKFDPERFNEENRDKIVPYTYIPFGAGPRNCMGSRFALLETKTLFFHILSSFDIVPTEKSQIPLKLCKKLFHLNAENGFWFGIKERNII